MKNNDPVLVIMAAGMGSRYGGLKQLEPLGPDGEILMDYSVFDAARAGFSQVIFVIRRDFEEAFDRMMRPKLGGRIRFSYAFQDPDDLPAGFSTPAGRVKPWGTGQAVLAARDLIRGPFAVINADDYYGPSAFQAIFDFLSGPKAKKIGLCVWRLRDTLSDHGHVSRGVCDIDGEGRLSGLREIKRIERSGHGARYTLDGGLTYQALDPDSPVSMNFWGFPLNFMDELKVGFSQFLKELEGDDPLMAEYLLPEVVSRTLETGKTEVMAIPVEDAWYGVTNKEDKPRVEDALNQLAREGVYPTPLWP